MSSVRGRDIKDAVKSLRDRARYDIAYAKDNAVNKLRKDQFRERPTKGGNIKATNFSGAVMKRGGDIENKVKQARERSQTIKAFSEFNRNPMKEDTKIYSVTGGPF